MAEKKKLFLLDGFALICGRINKLAASVTDNPVDIVQTKRK
jgi:hypothetical protein